MVSRMSIAGRMGYSSFGRSLTNEDGSSIKPCVLSENYETLPYVIGVVGSSTFNDKNYFAEVLDRICILHMCENIMFASIDSSGTGELVQEYTDANFLQFRQVGIKELPGECDECIVFWDGQSQKARKVFEHCQAQGKPVKLIDLTDR